MKSDLTCPVEVTRVAIRRGEEGAGQAHQTKESGQIVCQIEFLNLSEKETASIQMNIICFDAQGKRLGGRLVRAHADGGARARFEGLFAPEHLEGVTARVEASVEKVWFKDGVIWRREERNVREYTPNQLPEGRELDRLRAVAGADAAGYAREDDIVWMCVCGRANPTSDDCCMRCRRKREQVLKDYSFAAIDSTVGRKERTLEQQTRENLRRSSEQTVQQITEEKSKHRRRNRRWAAVVVLLALVAVGLAAMRWGVPYGACWIAQKRLDSGRAADAKQVFEWVNSYWPGFLQADERAEEAEQMIIEGLLLSGTEESLASAAVRAGALGSEAGDALYERAILARAQLAIDSGKADLAEELLRGLPQSEAAQTMLNELIYSLAVEARERLDYPLAIARFSELGDDEDAAAQRDECLYEYGRQLMREGEYELASEQLMQVPEVSDALALLRQCRYAIALASQEAGDYVEAAEAFESLGIYEEAESRAKICRYTAGMEALGNGDLEEAAVQLKAAKDYEDAQERFTDVVFTLGSAALSDGRYEEAIAWLEQIERTDEVAQALDEAGYGYAAQLEEAGQREEAALQYESLGDYSDAGDRANALLYAIALDEMQLAPAQALARFESLGSYQDAAEKAQACRYLLAQQRYEAGAYEEAVTLFEQLDGYSDAQSQARRSRYAWAEQLFEAGSYEESAAQYAACGAYLDAEDRAMLAAYEAAAALEAAGSYQAAAIAFAALGSYEDAKQRVTQNENSWLSAAYTAALLDSELGDYESVVEGLEALWQEDLPERYKSISTMYVEACLARADELIAQQRPLDALPFLERIPDNATAQRRLTAYVYQIIGRWKTTSGIEYVFRRDGSCRIDGEELYFGGSGYEIRIGEEPYPTTGVYSVVSLRNGSMTLRSIETGKDIRLSYLGEATEKEDPGDEQEPAPDGGEDAEPEEPIDEE